MPARNEDVIKYDKDDPGILTFPRSSIEAEIPTIVKSNSQAYVARGYEGRKVIILVIREDK